MILLGWLIVAYFLGATPFGLLIAKIFCGVDPRNAGSHNIGTTNVARLCGAGWGIVTLHCDVGKGALAVYVATLLSSNSCYISLVALTVLLGHVYSCFLAFKGGKAVATTIGIFAVLAFWPLLVAAHICMLVIFRSGYISLGSLTLVTLLPIFLVLWGSSQWVPLALLIMIFVFWRHRENIVRLLRGTEKPWVRSRYSQQKTEKI